MKNFLFTIRKNINKFIEKLNKKKEIFKEDNINIVINNLIISELLATLIIISIFTIYIIIK